MMLASSWLVNNTVIITIAMIVVYNVLSFLFNLLRTLHVFRRSGISLISIDYNTISSLWALDTRSLFKYLMKSFEGGSGIAGWLTPVGKPFIVVSDATVLAQIIVENAGKLTKHHAFGILELFRKTDLQSGPAWKVVHRIASKFPIHDTELQNGLQEMLSKFIDSLDTINGDTCFADFTRSYYWELVLYLVCGPAKDNDERVKLRNLYATSWLACISALSEPLAHSFSAYMWLPIPKVIRYRYLSWKLRNTILQDIKRGGHKGFTVLSVISNEMSIDDQLEVAMEFMFTGASSVTSSLIFFIYELAKDKNLQALIRKEVLGVRDMSKETVSSDFWLRGNELSECPHLEAALREVLRMYSPIHIGRLTLEDFYVIDKNNQKIKILRGTDIFSNPWFFQRNPDNFPNPDTFDHSRFIGKPHNIANYHPFSMGIRSCPGQRIAYTVLKLVVANIIIKYEISSRSSDEPSFQPNLMLPVTPADIYLDFKKI